MKSIIISALITLLFITSNVLAEDFSIQTEISSEYFAGKSGIVLLKINNPSGNDWFEIGTIGEYPYLLEPENRFVNVPSGETGTFLIFVKPSKGVPPNFYKYSTIVKRASTGSILEEQFFLNVLQTSDFIVKNFKTSCFVCRNNSIFVSGSVENLGDETKDITLTLKTGYKERIIPIGSVNPGDSKIFYEEFGIERLNPDSYPVEVKLTDGDGKVWYRDSSVFYIPTLEDMAYDKEAVSTPFGNFVTVTAINKGNSISDAYLTSDVNTDWYVLFNGPNPSGNILGEFLWTSTLLPGQSVSVSYSEIFWPNYVFIFLLIVGGVIAYWKVVALTVRKVSSRRRIGGGEEVSLSLHIRNRSREIDNVIARDVIPEGFSVTSVFATVKPVIRKIAQGTELVWRIGKLKKHEERVLHYKVKALREFAGRIHLQSAHIKAEYEEGKQLLRRSNTLFLHAQPRQVSVIPVKIE